VRWVSDRAVESRGEGVFELGALFVLWGEGCINSTRGGVHKEGSPFPLSSGSLLFHFKADRP
jgi:hypothetical protein